MTILQAMLLGVVQGITEFLPISSSAHLVLIPYWLGWSFDLELEFAFNIFLHVGTLVAVVTYFRNDIKKIVYEVVKGIWLRKPFESDDSKIGWLILIASVPAGAVGLLSTDLFMSMLDNPTVVASLLIVTAISIIFAEVYSSSYRRPLREISWKDSLLIGCFQALAIFPGISRSGITIVGGVFRRLSYKTAARFSFLMSIPVMVGAGLIAVKEVSANEAVLDYWPAIFVGFVSSVCIGLLSIHWLLRYLRNKTMRFFALYCLIVGLLGLLVGCSPAKEVAQKPIVNHIIGVTDVTGDFVKKINNQALYSDKVRVKTYASHRQLMKAISAGGVEAGIVFDVPRDNSLVSYPLAVTSIIVVVHPDVGLDDLSKDSLKSIFVGEADNWIEVGGNDIDIQPIVSEEGDAARLVFQKTVLDNENLSSRSVVIPEDNLVLQYVNNTAGSVGYVWEGMLDQESKQISVNTTEGLERLIYSVSYEEPSGSLRDWLNWIQHRTSQQLPKGYKQLPN
ncbi:MAG TPA: undecaprenyl-diphosphatase UppP [Chloroflexi bacterium]|nr:undecaprenyl-diphosphatase UppP [Chloroflexota bacterium]|tara:strand:- start:1695 stop:3215 length:1521 start_codon:yes stop_codon:yes gene_type:complete